MAKRRAKMGRPRKTGNEVRAVLAVRVAPSELRRIKADAKRLELTVSDLLLRPWREGV